MIRAWPDTLAGRILSLLIGMTLLLLVGSALLVSDERRDCPARRRRPKSSWPRPSNHG